MFAICLDFAVVCGKFSTNWLKIATRYVQSRKGLEKDELISIKSFNQKTYEDTSIVSPEDRKQHFGEEQHMRVYGYDFIDRLKEAGFDVQLDRAADLPLDAREKYGLVDNENVWYFTKA